MPSTQLNLQSMIALTSHYVQEVMFLAVAWQLVLYFLHHVITLNM